MRGQVEGTWRVVRGVPEISPFGKLGAQAQRAAESELADVIRHRQS